MADFKPINIELRSIMFWEGSHWIVQGIDLDICVQGRTLAETQARFEQTLLQLVAVDVNDGGLPLWRCPMAPLRFTDLWNKSVDNDLPSFSVDFSLAPTPAYPEGQETHVNVSVRLVSPQLPAKTTLAEHIKEMVDLGKEWIFVKRNLIRKDK